MCKLTAWVSYTALNSQTFQLIRYARNHKIKVEEGEIIRGLVSLIGNTPLKLSSDIIKNLQSEFWCRTQCYHNATNMAGLLMVYKPLWTERIKKLILMEASTIRLVYAANTLLLKKCIMCDIFGTLWDNVFILCSLHSPIRSFKLDTLGCQWNGLSLETLEWSSCCYS